MLDDAAKDSLVVLKLNETAYASFTNHIPPKRASEVSPEGAVKTLEELFEHNK